MGMIGIVNSEKSDTDMLFKEKFFSFNKFMFDEIQGMFEIGKMIEVLGMILKYLLYVFINIYTYRIF